MERLFSDKGRTYHLHIYLGRTMDRPRIIIHCEKNMHSIPYRMPGNACLELPITVHCSPFNGYNEMFRGGLKGTE